MKHETYTLYIYTIYVLSNNIRIVRSATRKDATLFSFIGKVSQHTCPNMLIRGAAPK